MCGISLHTFCLQDAQRSIETANPDVDAAACQLCSITCFRFSKIPELTPEILSNEREQLMKRNKESLKKEARESNVKVNCRVNGSSRDASKETIVARLLEKNIMKLYPGLAALATDAEGEDAITRIGISDKFRLINIIFSEELHEKAMTSEEAATRAELDAGLVGHKSPFWQLVHLRFNEGFPPDSTDGPTFANLIHHMHPLFHTGDTAINPAHHGTWTAEKLKKVWKDIIAEYDTVIVNFTKSGNHDSSFTRAAMRALVHNDDGSNNDSIGSNNTINSDEEADEFGTELGGWCCFTNSLPIVYLRMWLNDRPNMTSFVSRKIPDDCQLDTSDTTNNNRKRKMSAAVAVQSKPNNKQKKSPSESIAEAFTSLIQLKQNEAKPNDLSEILRGDMQSYMRSQSTKERIDLLEKQISVLQRRIQSCDSEEQRDRYSLGLKSLEAELDNLVMPPL